MMAFLTFMVTCWLAFVGAEPPGPNLFETLAQIGATFLVAYVVEVTWLVKASRGLRLVERETRLGRLLAVGAAVLVGISAAIWLASLPANHGWSLMNEIGFGLVVGTMLMAGTTIVMQPLFTHEWAAPDDQLPSSGRRSLPRPPIRSRR